MTSSDNLAMLFYVLHSFGFIGVPAFSPSPSWVWISRATEICCSRLHLPPHLLVDFHDFLSRMASFDFFTMGHCLRVAGSPTEQRDGTYRALAYILHMTWIRVFVFLLLNRRGFWSSFSFACIAWGIGWAAVAFAMIVMIWLTCFMIWDVGCLLMSMLRWWFDLGLLRSHTGWLCNLPLVYFLLSDTWQMPVHVCMWHDTDDLGLVPSTLLKELYFVCHLWITLLYCI